MTGAKISQHNLLIYLEFGRKTGPLGSFRHRALFAMYLDVRAPGGGSVFRSSERRNLAGFPQAVRPGIWLAAARRQWHNLL
jgi:hypothetical protein